MCYGSCHCVGHTISCSSSNLTSVPASVTKMKRHTNVRSLILSHNTIRLTPASFDGLNWLGRLNLSHNALSDIPLGCFRTLVNLYELDLSYNELSFIEPGTFEGLRSLRVLDLSNNVIRKLSGPSFSGLTVLRRLIISDNRMLKDVPQDTFVSLDTLETLNTDAYKYCCIAKHVPECTPEPDEFSSCEDLMANYILQISIWILGILATVGNAFVIFWRIFRERMRVSSFFIMNLGASDFLMGVYIIIIASVDVFYRGRYIVYADTWRTSTLCKAAGFLAILSSEVSVYMLTVITLERMFTIAAPLKFGNMRQRTARYIVGAGWIVCFIICFIPTVETNYFGDSFFGRTGKISTDIKRVGSERARAIVRTTNLYCGHSDRPCAHYSAFCLNARGPFNKESYDKS